ncbi:MAG: hypothetical protein FJ290_10830 [Planctomycetes bacterium]|nr:hypothetical protein [Planctomycetota bacterium]
MPFSSAAGEDLAPFLAVHQKASALGAEKKWAEAAKAYAAFAAASESDACAPLAAALQGIILLRQLNQAAPAREAFLRAAKAAAGDKFGLATRDLARGWLARLQMVQLDAALRRYWTDKIEYPEKLDALVERKLVPPELLVDPWGKPFAYAARPLKARPDLPRQAYTLSCSAIEGDSRSLKAALATTEALPKKFLLRGIPAGPQLTATIAFAEDKTRTAVNRVEGEKVNGATLVKLTPQGAIIIEGGAVAALAR